MPEFKTRRGLPLKAPSPFEPPPPPKKEPGKPTQRRKHIVDPQTRMNYFDARVRLGLSANAPGFVRWSYLHKATTFRWKFDTLEEAAKWMIISTWRDYHRLPHVDRRQIALHYAQKAFGVSPSDILGPSRIPPVVVPRYIAMLCLLLSGISRADTARRFKKDHTCVHNARVQYKHLFEGISFNDLGQASANSNDGGPASDGQSDGVISPPIHGPGAGDHQEAEAGHNGDPGGSDRGEGSAQREASEPDC